MKGRTLLALIAIPLLSGCAPNVIGTAEQICKTWEPIRPSRKDVLTQGTKEQIVGNNAANETWCQKGGAPQKVAVR